MDVEVVTALLDQGHRDLVFEPPMTSCRCRSRFDLNRAAWVMRETSSRSSTAELAPDLALDDLEAFLD